jgi:FtsP/CotA-like multicopper oxidase with cupredoxin domain
MPDKNNRKRYFAGSVGLSILLSLLFAWSAHAADTADVNVFSEEDIGLVSGVQPEPFTAEMPVAKIAQQVEPFTPQCSMEIPEGVLQPPEFYEVHMKRGTTQILPGVDTKIIGFDGTFPGPTFKARSGVPTIVRFFNDLDVATIVHNHGGHQPAPSDGAASVIEGRLIRPGSFRDFCYPNLGDFDPETFEQDVAEFPTTQWYHDHAHHPETDKGITGHNVYMGLAGFYLVKDELEQNLIDTKVLPKDEFDIPVVIQDKLFDTNGQLIFDEEAVQFDGVVGDVFAVNGKAQPTFHVQRRKYRFRFLNGSTARFIQLSLSHGKFLQIGNDTWLLPHPVEPTASDNDGTRENEIRLTPAQRADVIIDFKDASREVFLNNVLTHQDGRRPDKVVLPGIGLIKFIVDDGPPVKDDATIAMGTKLRPDNPVSEDRIRTTREFRFERNNGHWSINGQFFNHRRIDADPIADSPERWNLINGGGGWAHPIHIHDDAHHIVSMKGRNLDPQERFKVDTVRLESGNEAEISIGFRNFLGPFVMHCHNLEHEDMAMMMRFDIVEQSLGGEADASEVRFGAPNEERTELPPELPISTVGPLGRGNPFGGEDPDPNPGGSIIPGEEATQETLQGGAP